MSHIAQPLRHARISRAGARTASCSFSSAARSDSASSGPETHGLYSRSRYSAEEFAARSGRPAPSTTDAPAPKRRARAAHLSGGRLPTRDLRTLVQLHHLASTFIRPDTLDAAVDAVVEFSSTAPISDGSTSSEERLRGIAADRLRRAAAASSGPRGRASPALVLHGSAESSVGAIKNPFSVIGSSSDPPPYASRASKIPQALQAAREANTSDDLGMGGLGGYGAGPRAAPLAEQQLTAREIAVREALYGVVKISDGEKVLPGLEAVEDYMRDVLPSSPVEAEEAKSEKAR